MECMLLSAGGMEFVHWWEVVHSSECPLSEVPLYHISISMQPPQVKKRRQKRDGCDCSGQSRSPLKCYVIAIINLVNGVT